MQGSARLFNCARCRCQVVICSHCDRGNIYCGKRCSEAARRQSQREAGRRYQKTRRGGFAHAERQRRYRQRRRAKVTHQGSPPDVADETLPAESRASARRSPRRGSWRWHPLRPLWAGVLALSPPVVPTPAPDA